MTKGRVAFLWHMHQPDYRHPTTGAPVMPWVRMHALRGYRDVVLDTIAEGAAVTINVVPSLLDQMQAYARGQTDRHLELTRRPADTLDASEVEEVLETFINGHPALREAHPGYRILEARVVSGKRLGPDDIRDLQVWSTLAWFGSTAMRDYAELGELRAKDSGFTEDDKTVMLEVQARILRAFPDLFARAEREGEATLSTSPYYHPILPLLVDTRHARRSLPDAPEESLFAWPQDALEQLVRARDRVEAILGTRPRGLWPSEGAVSPEVVEIVSKAGFSWLATDQGVLEQSKRKGKGYAGGWDLGHGVVGFFRDRDLSDRVGFQYATRDPEESVAELLAAAAKRAGDRVLTIALDGENPWEGWADAGAAFRQRLYRGLRAGPIRGITLDAAVERKPVGRVSKLHTGSWIGANLGIWIGHEQDHTAWRLLGDARRAIEQAPPELAGRALEKLLPAEGSDWTWWYGDEFTSPFDALFDELFRTHVRAAWEALERSPPPALYRHIREGAGPTLVPPRRLIRPRLVGEPAWIHWSGAGRVRWPPGTAMARGAIHTTGFRFGWSPPDETYPAGCLWLNVDLPPVLPEEGPATWRVQVADQEVEIRYGEAGVRHEGEVASAIAGPRALVVRVDAVALPPGGADVVVEVCGRDRTRYPASGAVHLPRSDGLEWWKV
jgi:alpha-amylase/alpha-mannosidase (GH57 family)